ETSGPTVAIFISPHFRSFSSLTSCLLTFRSNTSSKEHTFSLRTCFFSFCVCRLGMILPLHIRIRSHLTCYSAVRLRLGKRSNRHTLLSFLYHVVMRVSSRQRQGLAFELRLLFVRLVSLYNHQHQKYLYMLYVAMYTCQDQPNLLHQQWDCSR